MPDTNRLPRIGEIWADKESGEKVLILKAGHLCTYIIDSVLDAYVFATEVFVERYKPTGTEYDLDPLVLALKGERT